MSLSFLLIATMPSPAKTGLVAVYIDQQAKFHRQRPHHYILGT